MGLADGGSTRDRVRRRSHRFQESRQLDVRILASKRAANRAKDRLAIDQIEQTLRVLSALKDE